MLLGIEAVLVTVEARFVAADTGRAEFLLLGLPDTVVRESRGRVSAALEEAGLRLPSGRLVLNLAPAGVPKSGATLDLALALAAAAAVGHLAARRVERGLYLGELGIDARIRDVPGGFAAAEVLPRKGAISARDRLDRCAEGSLALSASPFKAAVPQRPTRGRTLNLRSPRFATLHRYPERSADMLRGLVN